MKPEATRRRLAAAALAVALLAAAAHGQSEGIAVVGRGTASARPSVAEITVTVTGDGPLANDAVVKYRDAKRRLTETVEGLGLANVTVEAGGMSLLSPINQAAVQAMMRGGVELNVKSDLVAQERLRVVMSGVDGLEPEPLLEALVKVIDTLKDGAFTVGERQPTNWQEYNTYASRGGVPAAVTFRVPDTAEVRRRACEAAMADARQRAEALAALAGVKLGRVLAIEERQETPPMPVSRPGGEGSSAATDMFNELPVSVSVAVRFAIEP